jgi:hypothetical protein
MASSIQVEEFNAAVGIYEEPFNQLSMGQKYA